MNQQIQDKRNPEGEFSKLIPLLEIPWKRSKETIWEELEEQLSTPRIVNAQTPWLRWQFAAAAIFIGLIGIGLFMQLYTVHYSGISMQMTTFELPDNSKVTLGENSQVSIHPYKWWYKREVDLSGNAFFEVEKGSQFKVFTPNGSTEVLGTSFYVFSMAQQFEVICVTGRVKVKAAITDDSVILHPSQKARLLGNGLLKVEEGVETRSNLLEASQRIMFTSTPLIGVFQKMEELYGCEIISDNIPELYYTGSFNKTEPIENVLHILCRPFDLKFRQSKENVYIISE